MDKTWKYILGGGTFFGLVLIIAGLVVTGSISGNIAGQDQTQTPEDNTTQQPKDKVPWEGRSVNELVRVLDNNDNRVQGANVYEFNNKPDYWKDQEGISSELSEANNKTTDSNGEVTVSGEADTTDYLVVHKSGTYYEFKTVTYASGSNTDESLGEYNNAPEVTKVKGLTNYYTMSTSTIDLGVTDNATGVELTGSKDINPTKDTEVRLQKAVVSEGNHPPQENSDNTGDLDEGTQSIDVSIVTSNDKVSPTILTDSGIDKLSKGDNPTQGEFEMSLGDRVFNSDQGGEIRVDYKGDTHTTDTVADDGQLGDGEDVLGVQIIDDLGQTPGINSVTG